MRGVRRLRIVSLNEFRSSRVGSNKNMPVAEMSKRASVAHFARITDTYQSDQLENGNILVRGVPVFRSGTFRDSMGDQHRWEIEHLQQMVFNFGLLRNQGIFDNVPVRDGHRGFMTSSVSPGRVVGYVHDLYVGEKDGKGNTLLLADFEITEPDAAEKVDRGTFRARSAEVGYYETNDEVLYWPVFTGFAFVDIPAVEGLFSRQGEQDNHTPIRDSDEEGAMPRSQNSGGQTDPNQPGTTPPTNDGTPAPTGSGTGDGGQAPPEGQSQHGSPQPPTPPSPPPTPTPPAQHAQAPAAPSPTPAPAANGQATFHLFGQPTQDFGAVQQHITNLETLNAEFARQGRVSFVEGLAERNVIPATQVEGMTAHVTSLTSEQFETFRSMWESAPSNPLFAQHGDGPSNPDGATGHTESGDPAEIDILRERVEFSRKSGMTEEQIEKTESYKRLQVLEAKAS